MSILSVILEQQIPSTPLLELFCPTSLQDLVDWLGLYKSTQG